MAKYTELFIEYVNGGGELPALFGEITGFEDVFTGHFCDREIGFETEELFKAKLFTRAEIVIPVYKDKIARINGYLSKVNNPSKVTTMEYGAQKIKTTELPIDASTAEPSLINDNEEYTNEQTEEDFSINNIITMLKYLKGDDANIIEKLLAEFDDLFMQVY